MKSLKKLWDVTKTLTKGAGYATGKGIVKAKNGIVGIVKKSKEFVSKNTISAFFNNLKVKVVQLDENLAHKLEKVQESLENRQKPIPDKTWKVIKDTVQNVLKDFEKNGKKGIVKLNKILDNEDKEKGGKL